MILRVAPTPTVDCQLLQFKHLCKLKTLHDVSKNTYKKPTHLLAVSTMYGLTFVGENCGLKVIVSNKIFEDESQKLNPMTDLRSYYHRNISLPASPTHVDINSEQKLLSVAYCVSGIPVLRVYFIESFFHENVMVFSEIRLSSTSGSYVTDISWNPGSPFILACCISDGTLSTYTFNAAGHFEIKGLPKESNSVCVCWSPKGKQIVVGNLNGYLTQYLPELKAVKHFPPPPDLFSKPCTLCSIKWLSSFQFIGVYKNQEQYLTEDEDMKSCIVVVNTPKNGPVTYINYDDICYSSGSDRPVQFYFIHIPVWNLICVASSNATEVAVLSLSDDKVTWTLWTLEDGTRINLPMVKSGKSANGPPEESYPVGIAVDYSFPLQTPIGDKFVSMPALSVLTNEGSMCVYQINYLDPKADNVCVKANPIPSLKFFTTNLITDEVVPENEPSVAITEVVDVAPAHLSTSVPDSSGYTSSVEYTMPRVEEVTCHDTASVPDLSSTMSITSVLSNLSAANANFTVETSIVKGFASESVLAATNLPDEKTVVRSVSSPVVLSSSGTVNVKKVEPPKPRNDSLKKLKKRASVFENDIQEIKYLVDNIKIDPAKTDSQNEHRLSRLRKDSQKLNKLNEELRSEIDELKTSIIEVFARIQDVKSKHLQRISPGFQSLSDIQDVDPVTTSSLKNIENTINYVHSQVEKADKQLEEMWFKFSQDRTIPLTKVPILENVYETLVKQQKILNVLKRQTEKLEKNVNDVAYRLSRRHQSPYDLQSNASFHWFVNVPGKEESSLVELTKSALNLNVSRDDRVDAKMLAQKYSREHAKRFYLSSAKQVKLQELQGSASVTYIQSSRLERLKKKSLIVLSKGSCALNTEERPQDEAETTTPAKADDDTLKSRMFSPVSSDEYEIHDKQTDATVNHSVVSSTPVKGKPQPRFLMENTLQAEPAKAAPVQPSLVKPLVTTTAEAPIKVTFTLPSSVTITPIDARTKQNDVSSADAVPLTVAAKESPVSTSGLTMFPRKSFVSAHPMSMGSLQPTNAPSTLAATSTLATAPTATKTASTVSSLLGTAKPVSSTPLPAGNQITSTFTTRADTLFSTALSSAPTAFVAAPVTTTIASDPVDAKATAPNVTFSFASKSEAPSTLPLFGLSASSSLFSSKPLSVTAFSSGTSSDAAESGGGSLFKSVPSSLPLFGSLTAAATATTSAATASSSVDTISLPKTVAITPVASPATAPAVTTVASIFGGMGSIFGKPSASSAGTINFGSMLQSSGSIFASKSSTVTAAMPEKSTVFSTFSFASKPNEEGVTISEVTVETGDADKENTTTTTTTTAAPAPAPGTPPNTSFSFANLNPSLTFTPVKSDPLGTVVVPPLAESTTTTAAPIPLANNSTLFNVPATSSAAPTPTVGGAFVAAPVTTTAAPPAPATAVPTTSSASIDKAGSFFGNLNLGSSAAPTAGSVFGKSETSATSSASMFGGSGSSNVFSTAVTSAGETKPIFGSGAAPSLFGQSGGAAGAETNSVFGSTNANFQAGRSVFGGSPLFGAEASFAGAGAPASQPSSFGANTGSSLFGSGGAAFSTPAATSPFRSNTAGFGSPSLFSGGLQQQQQQQQPVAATGGFGSPPSFSSVFSKPSSFGAFGAAATFGGSATFGSSPTKTFGQPGANLGTFGSATTQSATAFETLANENTVSFGNLAQQQTSGFGSPPSFGNTNPQGFGAPSSFGGNAFSSWR